MAGLDPAIHDLKGGSLSRPFSIFIPSAQAQELSQVYANVERFHAFASFQTWLDTAF
jgi:hypothetical protein